MGEIHKSDLGPSSDGGYNHSINLSHNWAQGSRGGWADYRVSVRGVLIKTTSKVLVGCKTISPTHSCSYKMGLFFDYFFAGEPVSGPFLATKWNDNCTSCDTRKNQIGDQPAFTQNKDLRFENVVVSWRWDDERKIWKQYTVSGKLYFNIPSDVESLPTEPTKGPIFGIWGFPILTFVLGGG